MVFRAMVKDSHDVPFYNPLDAGLRKARRSTSSSQINSYLYGTRFLTWLARTYSPEQVLDWMARKPGSRGYYSAPFSGLRTIIGKRLGRLDRRRESLPGEESRGHPPISYHAASAT